MAKPIQSPNRINSNFLAVDIQKNFSVAVTAGIFNNAKNIIFIIVDPKSNRLSLVKTWGLTSPHQSKLEYDPDAVNLLSAEDGTPIIFGQSESFPNDWNQYEVFCTIMNAEYFLNCNIFLPKVMALIGAGQHCLAVHSEDLLPSPFFENLN